MGERVSSADPSSSTPASTAPVSLTASPISFTTTVMIVSQVNSEVSSHESKTLEGGFHFGLGSSTTTPTVSETISKSVKHVECKGQLQQVFLTLEALSTMAGLSIVSVAVGFLASVIIMARIVSYKSL